MWWKIIEEILNKNGSPAWKRIGNIISRNFSNMFKQNSTKNYTGAVDNTGTYGSWAGDLYSGGENG